MVVMCAGCMVYVMVMVMGGNGGVSWIYGIWSVVCLGGGGVQCGGVHLYGVVE